jgi:penicillin amidase
MSGRMRRLAALATALPWLALPGPLVAQAGRGAPPAAEALRLPGLRAPVTLTRDSAGIVHIRAANEHDLFFAQGYSAARDRLFQLELWRRQATGTMAEALGPRWVARDRASRLLRYRGPMAAELAHYHPRGAAIIGAFVAGINARVAQVRATPALLPPELAALGIAPQPWTPAVVVSRHNALASNARDETGLGRAVRAIGEDAVRRRVPFAPGTARLPLDSAVAELLGSVDDAALFADYDGSRTAPTFRAEELVAGWRRAAAAEPPPPREPERWESNNWVVAGTRTASGKPMLANDPHRAITTPSLRYLVHLTAPGWDVIGGGEPAIPGVAIGHNAHGAWGLTIFGIDTEDLYVYALAPGDPTRYRYRGQWATMATEVDTVRVRGGAPQVVTLRHTRHGPVLYSDSVRRVAVALRAAWLERGGAPYLASLRLDQARSWREARTALAYARMPTLNWVWADTSGTIGWQAAGIAPRRVGWDGLAPVPGDGRFEWAGFLPIAQLPHETNPARGFVGTANAYNVDAGYPHPEALARSWADPWRHDRLQQVLDTTRRADVASMAALQHDEVPLAARQLVPLLRGARPADGALAAARDTLLAWDGVLRADSRGGALYAAWERQLLARTAERVLPGPVRRSLRSVSLARTVAWLTRPDSLLGAAPEAVRDTLVHQALQGAVADLARRFGADLAAWRYGDARLHHARIAHVLDPLVTDSLRRWLSLGPVPRGGNGNTLNATGNGDNQTSGPSLRVVIDLADWDTAVATNTPGQSGDPRSPWYANLFPLWGTGRYVPLPYSPGAVRARAAEVVTLRP